MSIVSRIYYRIYFIFLLAINIDITWLSPDFLMTCRFRVPEGDALTSAMDVFVAKMIQTAAIVIKDLQVEARYDVGLHMIKGCHFIKRDNQLSIQLYSSLQSWRTRYLRFVLEIKTKFENWKPWFSGSTLPKTKIAPETLGLEVWAYFQGLDVFSFREDLIRSNVWGWKSYGSPRERTTERKSEKGNPRPQRATGKKL